MKLVAIWVENYMSIKNQVFNFGSKYTYDFKLNSEKRQILISASKTPDYFQLFSKKGITNITGIIGINGSGKTSLLRLLNVMEADKPLTHPVLIILENPLNSKLEIYTYISKDSKFFFKNPIEIIIPEEGIISKESIKNKLLNINKTESPFKKMSIIYYSNLYSDQNDKWLNMNNPRNRSVDYQTRMSLTPDSIQKYLDKNKKYKNDDTVFVDESFNLLKLYFEDRLKRMINFLVIFNTKHKRLEALIKDIHIPNTVTIWFNEEIFAETEKLINQSLFDFKRLPEINQYCIKKNNIEKSIKIKFKNELIFKIFLFTFYNDYFKQSKNRLPLDDLSKFINNLILDDSIFDKILELLLIHNRDDKFYMIGKINDLLKNIDSHLDKVKIIEPKSIVDIGSYKLIITEDLWKFLSIIISITDYKSDVLFRYSINPFSAGESALLNQFSEFYETFEHLTYNDKENVIVCIDEGELYMHPEWQRKYINSLYVFFDYFNKKLNLNKNFQFIITSHSPFISSDIPSHNLIFLKKENGLCKVSNSINHKPTLGGNIFELFSDGFFVNEFISQFAFEKINDAFKFLNNKKQQTFKNLLDVEGFLKLIGEPLIRDEIQKMVNRKKSKDFDKYYEIVELDKTKILDISKEKTKK